MPSLNQLRGVRDRLQQMKRLYYTRVWHMDIDPTARFSFSAHFDRTHPRGVHVGAHTYVTLGVTVLAHDFARGLHTDTWIGRNCFIGAHSIIMPGVRIGDGSIVAAGSVVTRDVNPGSIVGGNPARTLREHVKVGPYGRLLDTVPPEELENLFAEVEPTRARSARRLR